MKNISRLCCKLKIYICTLKILIRKGNILPHLREDNYIDRFYYKTSNYKHSERLKLKVKLYEQLLLLYKSQLRKLKYLNMKRKQQIFE